MTSVKSSFCMASGKADLQEWNEKFLESYTLAAEKDGTIAGGNIEKNGYLDMLLVHKDYQRLRETSPIYDELEKYPSAAIIFTHASITAKLFLRREDIR